jgi:hypothetical protein
MGIRKGGKSPRRLPKKLSGLDSYKKLGWSISRNKRYRNKTKGGWKAVKRGVEVCAACTRSLMNRMQAKECAGKWRTPA